MAVIGLLAAAVTVAGCGNDERKNKLKPPVQIIVTVEIGSHTISASPSRFGGGPTTFKASNQTQSRQKLTVEGAQLEQSTEPFGPGDSESITVTLKPGQYTLSAGQSSKIEPEIVTVTKERPSSQNRLLLP